MSRLELPGYPIRGRWRRSKRPSCPTARRESMLPPTELQPWYFPQVFHRRCGELQLSYSKIETYETCPAKFRFQYEDRVPGRPSPVLSFGDSLHRLWLTALGGVLGVVLFGFVLWLTRELSVSEARALLADLPRRRVVGLAGRT